MKSYDWDKEKNEKLKEEREISFDDIVNAIQEKRVLDVINHPNKRKYPGQKVYVIAINDYVYIVPFVESEEKYFLKTIFPSRKMTKKYLIERRKK